ncbi:MAG TPA: metalloregulator ArsR/SmtB family transcription factor [Oscillatoriaceae cyanobacterium]
MRERRDRGEGCCSGPVQPLGVPQDLADQAKRFKALADETRLKLIHLVREREVCVCDLVDALGMPQGTLSHHLSLLHQAGLVTQRKQGRWNYYQATPLAHAPISVFATTAVTPSKGSERG